MELTRRRGVAHYDYTAGNLTDDLADIQQIEKQLPPPVLPGD